MYVSFFYIKWLVATYQIVSDTPAVFNIAFPRAFADFLAAFSIFDFNYSTLFQCGDGYNFVSNLIEIHTRYDV